MENKKDLSYCTYVNCVIKDCDVKGTDRDCYTLLKGVSPSMALLYEEWVKGNSD